MIDTRRWILVEAWMSLGLRVEWASRYELQNQRLFEGADENQRYFYAGRGVWGVQEQDGIPYKPYGRWTVPTLGIDTLRHELAHYLVASIEQREMTNFGAGEEEEQRAVAAEQVIDAMLQASGRIAALAIRGTKP